ncbi:MAG: branched-chain amino acid ABC transporter permease, partial [Jatrophihabitantaceae bacterium]
GAMILGLGPVYISGYIPSTDNINGFRDAVPTMILFLVLLFVPQVRLRVGQIKGILAAPVPSMHRTLAFGVVLIAAIAIITPLLSDTNVLRAGTALAFAMVMLSLVLLTGYGGHVSLAQLSFMGIGAAVVCKLNTGSPFAIVFAVVVAAAVGALVALPVLRLTGLFLALATLAFAQMMDKLVFQANFMFGFNGLLHAKRVSLFGITFGSARSYLVLMAIVFVLMSIVVLSVRRGPVGRLLIAMRDSPAACGTLGLNQRWFRVGLFSASAGMAGLAGALFVGLTQTADPSEFQSLSGLVLLLLAVVCGVTSVTGALVGGFLLMFLPVLQSEIPGLAGLEFLVIGIGAVSLGRDPNGLANKIFDFGRFAQDRLPPVNWGKTKRKGGQSPALHPDDSDESTASYETDPASADAMVSHGTA